MAASSINVSTSKLWYGTAAEITALATGGGAQVGDVGFATDENREYTCTNAVTPTWIITREYDSTGSAHVNPEKGPEGDTNGGETVSYTATAGTSAALTADFIDVTCTTDSFVAIASAPTATTDGYFCSAGLTYRFPITSGNKVSAIRLTTDGTMYIHPVS
jgi:hypothetical protein